MELWRLRHTAARATVDALNSSERTISGDITHAPVKLSAEVCGVGPVFRLYLTIQNLSTYKMASNLVVLLHADRRHYTIQKSMTKVNILLLVYDFAKLVLTGSKFKWAYMWVQLNY